MGMENEDKFTKREHHSKALEVSFERGLGDFITFDARLLSTALLDALKGIEDIESVRLTISGEQKFAEVLYSCVVPLSVEELKEARDNRIRWCKEHKEDIAKYNALLEAKE